MIKESNDVHKAQCGKCGYIIGMSNRDHLSVKTGDFFIYFYGGMAILSCKLCHALNLVVDDEYEKENAELVYKAENMLNSCRAVFVRWQPNKEHSNR